eukprot:2645943-Pyramimonas_sp.AAC.2
MLGGVPSTLQAETPLRIPTALNHLPSYHPDNENPRTLNHVSARQKNDSRPSKCLNVRSSGLQLGCCALPRHCRHGEKDKLYAFLDPKRKGAVIYFI